ncbi:MAG: SprT-like domain-containing protein [Campylobacterota bacterium]|nr:SprT-like domain-containing protein [Campylobacterota bacterium]
MFKKKLEIIFLSIIAIAIAVLAKNYYDSYSFKHHDIPKSYKEQIIEKEKEILSLMQKHYGFVFKVPVIVTDKFEGRLYGLTSYRNGEIKIYLNKKVMQESMDYIVDSVIAHEYAHALMFKQGYIKNGGHSPRWLQTCKNLGGINCGQYVNQNDVVMGKMPF